LPLKLWRTSALWSVVYQTLGVNCGIRGGLEQRKTIMAANKSTTAIRTAKRKSATLRIMIISERFHPKTGHSLAVACFMLAMLLLK
jgi:hypothetical protein